MRNLTEDLEIRFCEPREIPVSIRKKYPELFEKVRTVSEIPGMILFAELLTMLGNTSQSEIRIDKYSAYFTHQDNAIRWTIQNGPLTVTRDFSLLRGEWIPRADTATIEGFAAEWNGELGDWQSALTIKNFPYGLDAQLSQILGTLFSRWNIDGTYTSPEPVSPTYSVADFTPSLTTLQTELDSDLNAFEVWHDGLDAHQIRWAIDAMNQQERLIAVAFLSDRLKSSADERITEAMIHLRMRECLPALREAFLNPAFRASRHLILQAILTIDPSAPELRDFIEMAMTARNWNASVDVLVRLKIVLTAVRLDAKQTIRTTAPLLRLLEDTDYLTRYHAGDCLLKLHGFRGDISQYPDVFECLVTKDLDKPTPKERVRFALGIERMKAMLSMKKSERPKV